MELQTLCTMCSNVTTILCGTCKCTTNFSAACLKADLLIHQILNGELQKFMAPPRHGIYFPIDQKTPQFVWATTRWSPREDGDPGYVKLNLKPYHRDKISNMIRVYGNYIRSRPWHDRNHGVHERHMLRRWSQGEQQHHCVHRRQCVSLLACWNAGNEGPFSAIRSGTARQLQHEHGQFPRYGRPLPLLPFWNPNQRR